MTHSPIVDAHTHIASPDRTRFPLAPRSVGSGWFEADDVGIEGLLAVQQHHGVDHAVIVQAIGVYRFDNSYAVEAARRHAPQVTLTGSIDMDAANPVEALEALHREAGPILTGIRLFGVFATTPTWLSDERADAVWEMAGRLGIVVVATLFPASLPELAKIVRRHPDTPVVVEHIGFVDLTGGKPFPAAQPLFDLAEFPAVHLKVTSHSLEDALKVGDPADLMDELVARFGVERLLWGSDFPQTQSFSYAEMLDLAARATRRMSEADRARFMGGTAHELWWAGR